MILLLAVMIVFVLGQRQADTKQNDKIAQRLSVFESDWLTASLNKDEAWLERLLSGKLVVISSESEGIKNRTQKTAEMIDPALKPNEMKVRITGNIRVLTNNMSESGSGNSSYYFLDTFNKHDGKWEMIASHFSHTPELANKDTEQALMQMERELRTAFVKRDVTTLGQIIADDFAGVESSGKIINKVLFIKNLESGDDVQSETPENMKVRIFGDTAVVNGRLLIKGKKKEDSYALNLFFTNTWVKQNGQWRLINYQSTQIKD